jgi:hypothetical protein
MSPFHPALKFGRSAGRPNLRCPLLVPVRCSQGDPLQTFSLESGLARFIPIAGHPVSKLAKLTDGYIFRFDVAVACPWRTD